MSEFMRLGLRKALAPYQSLSEIAEALKVTVPEVKRQLREMEPDVSLDGLVDSDGVPLSVVPSEELFRSFHQRNLCLICGNGMKVISRRAGWGEFSQCTFCEFSVHENADYESRRENAIETLRELNLQLKNARRVLAERAKQSQRVLENP